MSGVAVAAGAAVKHEAKHLAEKKAKSKLRKKVESKGKDAYDGVKVKAKKTVKKNANKFVPHKEHAPMSFSVRKQKNILVGMWFASIIVYTFAFLSSNGTITIGTFWKRFITIHFTFLFLSILVLFDTFARAVGIFSVLVFLAILLQPVNSAAIVNGLNNIAGVNKKGITGAQPHTPTTPPQTTLGGSGGSF